MECQAIATTWLAGGGSTLLRGALFDDPILANSALDRFAHRAHQIVMEGPSLRAARAPSTAKGSARSGKTAAPGG